MTVDAAMAYSYSDLNSIRYSLSAVHGKGILAILTAFILPANALRYWS
jgi:hypothetical protein